MKTKRIVITKKTHLENVIYKGQFHEDVLLEPGDMIDANQANQMVPDYEPEGVMMDDADFGGGSTGGFYDDPVDEDEDDGLSSDPSFDDMDEDDFEVDEDPITLTEPTEIEGNEYDAGTEITPVYTGDYDEVPYSDPDDDGDNDAYPSEDTDDDMDDFDIDDDDDDFDMDDDDIDEDEDTSTVDLQPYGNGNGMNDFSEEMEGDNSKTIHDVEGNPIDPASNNPYVYNGEAPELGAFTETFTFTVPAMSVVKVPGYRVILETGDKVKVFSKKRIRKEGK